MNAIDRALLLKVARRAMDDYGMEADFSPAALQQAASMTQASVRAAQDATDLRHLPWSSIDNPESRDLDQIEAVEEQPDGGWRLYVAIAHVGRCIETGSAIDLHAAANTTSVYTGVQVFTMLPETLSYGLTSLLPDADRAVLVIDMRVDSGGVVREGTVYPAVARNKAKLNYPAISSWLDGSAAPAELRETEMQRQLYGQDALAQALRRRRMAGGALDLDTAELRPVLDPQGQVVGLEPREQDRAGAIIEELMIAANETVVRYLEANGTPAILRVVRNPEHWDRIVEYAAGRGVQLPAGPDSKALSDFLQRMRERRPHEFHEISLAIVKLIGRGEYVARQPGTPPVGHFGLAAPAYGHATAPNRRYPDVVMQRLLAGDKFASDGLEEIAAHCSAMERQADKVERRVRKSIAAALIAHRIGDVFEAVVTKATDQGLFVHVFHPAIEGMIVQHHRPARVGDKVRARLLRVDIEQSLIDFALVD